MQNTQAPYGTEHLDWLAGGGEMSRVIRSMDWSQTPLGSLDSWPQSLRTTVSLCLASNFPISIVWGPQHIQLYNDGYWPICGAKHPQSMGQDFKQCWASAWPAIGDAFERALEGETSYIENRRVFVDRYGYLEETFFTFSFSPIRDESGRIGGLFHPVTETTGRMISERRARVLRDLAVQSGMAKTMEEAYAFMFQTLAAHELDIPFGLLYLSSQDGKRAHLVKAIGLPPDSKACPSEMSIDPSHDAPWPLAAAAHFGKGEQVNHLAERFELENCGPYPEPPQTAWVLPIILPGLQRPLAFFIASVSSRLPFDDAYKDFLGLVAQQVAVSIGNARAYEAEAKRAEKLAELDRAKTAFFSNVSHEFRTPLTLILGPLEELMCRGIDLPQGVRNEIGLAHRNGLRLLRLVNTLLDFSRIEAGRARACFRQTEIGTLTRDLASSFRSAMTKARLSYEVTCEEPSRPVFIDRDMWEKVVLNLISNAFKYTLKGHVSVKLAPADDKVELIIEDSGIGIPERELPHIFDRFHRIEGAHGRTQEGSGIGLALVRELLKLHGGNVAVTSSKGKGTKFTVSIPTGNAHLLTELIGNSQTHPSTALGVASFVEEALRWVPDEGPDEVSSLVPPRASPERERPRLLLADDNADMRDYIVRLLTPICQVEAVTDGEAALASALARPPDLILSDVMMPRLNGFELIQALKGNPITKSTPVILLSARAGEESRIEGLYAGADDYLVKPFSARELLARVQTQLQVSRLRAAVDEERARMFSIFMQAPIAICILDGPDHIFDLSNPLYDHLVQRQVLGKKVREAFTEAESGTFLELLDRAYETGEPYIGRETSVPFLDAEGMIRQRFIDFGYHPIRNSQGQITGLLALHIDVTEQVEARSQLVDSERKFRNLADSMPQMIWTADESGRLDYCNQVFVEFSRMNASEMSSWADPGLIHAKDYNGALGKWKEALESGELYEWEARFRRHDGIYRWFLVKAVLSKGANGNNYKWFGSCTDIEHQKQLAMELELAKNQAENASVVKSRFLANMSHEIRTPLGIILGFSEFLLDPEQTPSDRHDCTVTIRRNAAQLSSLVNELLDISKIEADRLEIEKTRFELMEHIREVDQLLAFQAKEKGVELQFRTEGYVQTYITTDRMRLRQILINVVGNALKFTEKGRVEVRISMSRVDESMAFANLRFDIIDTGIGLTAEQAERIWAPFVQADSSTTRRFGGTGLGLTLSQRLAHALGGELVLTSSAIGQGSHFTLNIDAGPCEAWSETQEGASPELTKPSLPAQPSKRLVGARILLVEDSADNQILIERILSREGACVDVAENGEEGVSRALSCNYDTILMDVQMPVLDGYGAVSKLRKRGYKVPIIALTARAMKGEHERAIAHGFSDHLSKPVDQRLIVEKLHNYLHP
ncbi:MAG TPA: ATP-binding protein [Oligoflexus sp.]|uniref:ATP-binding protein n=1 Tax=Oligoflexus sp. TaxID=1971216 RepID=UPI002D543222|nr:ATP-binding protein [Oligoflexus sp.]HYX38335.1 ATP-binding protein [Oligoflexus sp.]